MLGGARAQTNVYNLLLAELGQDKLKKCLWTRAQAMAEVPLPQEVKDDFVANALETTRLAHRLFNLTATSAMVGPC